MSYKKFVEDVNFGDVVFCFDGIIFLIVLFCDMYFGFVCCWCENFVVFGERKNVNFFGIVVDFLIFIEKDKEDIF